MEAAAFTAFRAQIGDDRSALIDPDEQASIAEALLEIARERRDAPLRKPLELLHADGAGMELVVCQRAAVLAGRRV